MIATEQPSITPLQNEPSRGHPPRRVQVDSRGRISFRPALQDLLDPATGYPESARLEFTQVKLETTPKLRLHELSLFRTQSIAPASQLKFDPSWKVGAVLDRHSSDPDQDSLGANFEATGGLTLSLLEGQSRLRAFVLTGTRIHLGDVRQGTFIRPAVSLETGLHARLGDRMALLATIQRLRFLNSTVAPEGRFKTLSSIEARLTLTPRWGLGASRKEGQWQAELSYFF